MGWILTTLRFEFDLACVAAALVCWNLAYSKLVALLFGLLKKL